MSSPAIEKPFPDKSLYDLLIITPKSYKNNLIQLVEHKNNYGLKTNLITLEEIYNNYTGLDHPEQIKYCIKNSVEEKGIKYVLLVGDIRKLPIRQTDAYPWEGYHGNGILTDLYYSDIYNENRLDKFCHICIGGCDRCSSSRRNTIQRCYV